MRRAGFGGIQFVAVDMELFRNDIENVLSAFAVIDECGNGRVNNMFCCPAGILRMEDKQASVVVQNQLGEQFTINFMQDYVNAANREFEPLPSGDATIQDETIRTQEAAQNSVDKH